MAIVSSVCSFDPFGGMYNCQRFGGLDKMANLSMDLWYKDEVAQLGAIMLLQQKQKTRLGRDVWHRIALFVLPKQLLSLCKLPKAVLAKAVSSLKKSKKEQQKELPDEEELAAEEDIDQVE